MFSTFFVDVPLFPNLGTMQPFSECGLSALLSFPSVCFFFPVIVLDEGIFLPLLYYSVPSDRFFHFLKDLFSFSFFDF